MTTEELDLVGPAEIAERLATTRATVSSWRHRGLMPAPLAVVGGVPVWDWPAISAWAQEHDYPRTRK